MKSFLIKFTVVFAVVVGAIYVLADDTTTSVPDVTVESLDDAIDTTLDIAVQYVDDAIRPITSDLGPQADAVLFSLTTNLADLSSRGINFTGLQTLTDEATIKYNYARKMFSKAMVYIDLGDILASEAEDAMDAEAYALRVKAAACYYEAAIFLVRSRTALETVLEIGEEAASFVEELMLTDTYDDMAGRYHLRKRTKRFFKRSVTV